MFISEKYLEVSKQKKKLKCIKMKNIPSTFNTTKIKYYKPNSV